MGLATLLIKTTRWSLLTKALAKLGVPTGLVTVLDLTYRYIYLFLFLFMEYLLGRKSRLVGRESKLAPLAWIGGTISGFLRLTVEYSQELSEAMQSRGYCGEHFPGPSIQLHRLDLCFLLTVIILCYYASGGIIDGRIFGI